MLIHHSSQFFYRVPTNLAFRGFELQASPLHAVKNFIKSVKMVSQGEFSYNCIIYVAHHEVAFLFLPEPNVFEWSPSHCESRRHLFPLITQLTRLNGLTFSCFCKGTCQKAELRSNVVKKLASPSFKRLSSMSGMEYLSLLVPVFR